MIWELRSENWQLVFTKTRLLENPPHTKTL